MLISAVADVATVLRSPGDLDEALWAALRCAGQAGLQAAAIRHRSGKLESCWGDPEAASRATEDDDHVMVSVVPGRRVLVLVGEVLNTASGRAFGIAVGACFAQALRLEARLTRAQRDFRDLIESSPDPLAILGGGLIVYANPSWCQTLAADDPVQVPGTPLLAWIHPEDRDVAAGHMRHPESPTVEVRVANRPDRWLELATPRPVRFDGEPAELLVARDVTARRRMQEGLLVSDRMATIGLLSAGVAHEINNPLTAIVANVEIATRRVREHVGNNDTYTWLDELHAELDDARVAADQVRSIVRDLRMFSRGLDEALIPVDVRRVMDSSLKMAANALRHRANIERRYADVPSVAGTPSRLGQVFLNLLVNAAQAFQTIDEEANWIRVTIGVDGGSVVIEVQDNGPGIRPDLLPRLFQPFVTSKPQGEGTGLGLSICQRIVTDLGGRLEVSSALGQGATFRIVLPAVSGGAAATPVLEPPTAVLKRGRVLVIDDEPLIGRAVRRMLGGDEVIAIQDGQQALTRLATDKDWDLILLDLMMPGLTGMEVYEALQARNPEVLGAVVLMTGGTFTERSRRFLDSVGSPRIEKPFEQDLLRRLLDERLAS